MSPADTPKIMTLPGPWVVTAVELAQEAAEMIHGINYITGANGDSGLRYPSDIERTLAALATLARRSPQALEQLTAILQEQHSGGQVAIDAGTEFAGDPGWAVSTATASMESGGQLARQLDTALGRAAQALAHISHTSHADPRPAPVPENRP